MSHDEIDEHGKGVLRTGAVTRPGDPPLVPAPAEQRFHDRADAGRRLAALLESYRCESPLVVGMLRGGVPVAAEVARALDAPLDIVVVRKIGAPHNPEYAVGAVAEGGVCVISHATATMLGLSGEELGRLIATAEGELAERRARYRGTREPLAVAGRTVILVDDGLATGLSARAAIESLRRRGAAHVVLAVPVAAPESLQALKDCAHEIVCVEAPTELWAVGLWYDDFSPVPGDEVTAILDLARRRAEGDGVPGAGPAPRSRELAIELAGGIVLSGDLTLPSVASGVVVFAHGSGSSRLSPRNRAVADAIVNAGYATLLFDLLTAAEERERTNVFDIPLLAARLIAATAWLQANESAGELPLAFFGASTGAAAALTAAATLGDRVRAVISRGGRPDLSLDLGAVTAPTLLIVGGADTQVLQLNREAQRALRCPSELAVVPGATHLFEEAGALEQVSSLAVAWLRRHLPACDAQKRPAD
ncbi:MAG TPA: phosphoribosyltransferase family protein [Solirubrobacteraceae bacterium]|nr:phosphoribosyltransferase family protein [Solirubrobacteraceae bacterium]